LILNHRQFPDGKGKSEAEMSKYAFLRSNASLVIIGLILGLAGGFKIANSQYRREQSEALKRDIDQATRGMSNSQAETNAIIKKARDNPNDADAQLDADAQFLQLQRPQEAMTFLEQAKKVDPNDRRVSAGLGVAYYFMGQFDQAIDSLKRSRDLGANSPFVTSFLIDSYIQTKRNLNEVDQLLKELETQDVDPARLAQIKADLDAARSGGTASPGASPSGKASEAQKPKTTLSHGPEEPKPKSQQSGGRN
jgi:tetratricopeptide (TPR) repeat protein